MNKILSKSELNDLGKEGLFNQNRLISKLSYISGIKAFDDLLEGKLFTEVVALINIKYRKLAIEIQMMKGVKYYSIAIPHADIDNISIEDQEQLLEQKEKSIVGRAILGGLVFGPVGAVIGGLTGMGTKEIKANDPESILSIQFKESGKDRIILFSCRKKDRKAVQKYFDEILK